MNASEAIKIIGKQATILLGGMAIHVVIIDVKAAYGRTRYLVTPVSGEGMAWVESIRSVQS